MFHRRQLSHQGVGHDGGCAGTFGGLIFFDIWSATQVGDNTLSKDCTNAPAQTRLCWAGALILLFYLWQHRTIPALRLKHRSGGCGTASALPKCSIMSGCGTRIVLRGQKPLALCDRCPCFGSLFPPLAALTFAASSIICAFGLAAATPRSPYRHLELCGIAIKQSKRHVPHGENTISRMRHMPVSILSSNKSVHPHWLRHTAPGRRFGHCVDHHRPDQRNVR